MSDKQKLIDMMFEVAITAALYMPGQSKYKIAEWVREQLAASGFDVTPVGSSWGVLR